VTWLAIAGAVAAAWLCAAQSYRTLDLVNPAGERVIISAHDARATVVIFSSTVCPVSNDYVLRLKELHTELVAKDVQFLVVYSNQTESLTDIRRHAREGSFSFPVYKDENNRIADRLDARLTPEAFVMSQSGGKVWRGPIDDHTNPARVKKRLLHDAVMAVLDGRAPAASPVQPYG